MFTGEYRHNLDSKNRLIMPAKFRDGLGEVFFITKGHDGCLTIYSDAQFTQIMEELNSIPSTNAKARSQMRLIASAAQESSLDSQGRIQLNPLLKAKTALDKNAVILGVWDHIEIWPEDVWEEYQLRASEHFEDDAEELTGLLK